MIRNSFLHNSNLRAIVFSQGISNNEGTNQIRRFPIERAECLLIMDTNHCQTACASQKRLYILFSLSMTSSIRGQTVYTKLSVPFVFRNYFHRC